MQRTHGVDSDEQAAEWLQRLDDPQIDELELQAWLEWFTASQTNRAAFEQLQDLRLQLRNLSPQLHEELKRRTLEAPTGNAVGSVVSPTLAKTGRGFSVRTVLAIAAGVGAIAIAGVGGWQIYSQVETAAYAAPVDQHRSVVLDDGTAVILASGSLVDVAYSRKLRSLNVHRGAVYFEVEHDTRRPFVVRAGEVSVTAVGTAFTVVRDSSEVTVTVTEGAVSVADAASRSPIAPPDGRVLRVGQRAVLHEREATKAARGSTVLAGALDDSRADFINTRLSEVLVVINRFSRTRIVIDDPRIADLTYSGTIMREHVDEWIASLPRVYPIRAVPLEDGTLSLVQRRDARPINAVL